MPVKADNWDGRDVTLQFWGKNTPRESICIYLS